MSLGFGPTTIYMLDAVVMSVSTSHEKIYHSNMKETFYVCMYSESIICVDRAHTERYVYSHSREDKIYGDRLARVKERSGMQSVEFGS